RRVSSGRGGRACTSGEDAGGHGAVKASAASIFKLCLVPLPAAHAGVCQTTTHALTHARRLFLSCPVFFAACCVWCVCAPCPRVQFTAASRPFEQLHHSAAPPSAPPLAAAAGEGRKTLAPNVAYGDWPMHARIHQPPCTALEIGHAMLVTAMLLGSSVMGGLVQSPPICPGTLHLTPAPSAEP
ncbi:hypothetical protein GGP41_005645, partial [Bipolaris sorokiniana]